SAASATGRDDRRGPGDGSVVGLLYVGQSCKVFLDHLVLVGALHGEPDAEKIGLLLAADVRDGLLDLSRGWRRPPWLHLRILDRSGAINPRRLHTRSPVGDGSYHQRIGFRLRTSIDTTHKFGVTVVEEPVRRYPLPGVAITTGVGDRGAVLRAGERE